jgi:sugar phosphate isomerase/epimerase
LRSAGPEELARDVVAAGLRAVQLALDPLRTGAWSVDRTAESLGRAGIAILSGMMTTRGEDYSTLETIRETGGFRPDAHWEANLAAARETAALARRLDLGLVTFHAGFLPHDPRDPERPRLLERLRAVADAFATEGIRVAFETGQETAATLLECLDALDRPEVGINFDPANLILYGMGNPVEALRHLGPRVVQIHVKDALPSEVPGTWGTEVPVGSGSVPWETFFEAVAESVPPCAFVIERESGDERIGDVRQAQRRVRPLVAALEARSR